MLTVQNNPAHGACLREEVLTGYLEGVLDPVVKTATEVHLAACDDCRQTLALLMRLLNQGGQPVSAAEEAELTLIASTWQRKRLVTNPRSSFHRLIYPFAGIAAVALFGWFLWWTQAHRSAAPSSAEEVVQLLMEEKRPFEPRLSGQPYKRFERTRGLANRGGVHLDLVAKEMKRLGADNYHWCKFYLLEGDFARALPLLEQAANDAKASASVHNDLGAALLAAGNEANLDRASQQFQRALEKDPGFAPAIFNLALFFERSQDPPRAETEWRRYLRLDAKSGWASEARARLDASR
jgi:tetratricopeptide (TPR) repeat protein